ncbi:MAG: BREX-2 system adenine-specific DNA-methyltransferase PglX, partial [Myxococcales bacterium]|nr:BREX-2 system adenine-specific DNA-methyltransferase PglX [Myxococcales bacterium]
MIDRGALLADLQKLVTELENDLRDRCEEHAPTAESLKAEHRKARDAGRTAHDFPTWREDLITQASVAWVLACVFVRFVEDNGLIETPRLSGPGPSLQRARDEHTHYFQQHPTETDREYLLHVFREAAKLPAMGPLYDEEHNPLFRLGLSADGATKLLGFWQRIDPDSGALGHDFSDPTWDTRFLGDLYQDLSAAARKKYALLQTPDFIESFILDRTLDPAIGEFGLATVTLIDPACGSGHFLLGAFDRVFKRWQAAEPGTNPRALAQRALDVVHGVDLNPFAVSIARFRLLLAAAKACGIRRLSQSPAFAMHLAAGDSLFHGRRPGRDDRETYLIPEVDPLKHVYTGEDEAAIKALLERRYHVVVGNPPYIVPNDAALNAEYRAKYGSCYRQYSLGVPFTERFFDLALVPEEASGGAGFIGTITANSFMKREFGKRLIEEFIPRWDLTHIIDSSGAYIPGHGTPTVILFARNRKPVADTVRTVMGIRGEPATPDDPAQGLVWLAILAQIDRPGSESTFVSVDDVARERFAQHPWSMGGGGAAELRTRLEMGHVRLSSLVAGIGRTTVLGEDDVWIMGEGRAAAARIDTRVVPLVIGEAVRDWALQNSLSIVYPYERIGGKAASLHGTATERHLWRWRTLLSQRTVFGKTMPERGQAWHEHLEHYTDKLHSPMSIAFAFVATHNHFVLDRGGKVFKQTAPVIKLPPEATEGDHLALLGLLNSSTACFWMKQVFYPKASATGDISTEKGRPEANRYEIAGTGLLAFPVPDRSEALVELTRQLDTLASQAEELQPDRCICTWASGDEGAMALTTVLENAEARQTSLKRRMVAVQEELDWECYRLYGICDEGGSLDALQHGAHEIDADCRPGLWSGSTPPVAVPAGLRDLYVRRHNLIAHNASLGIVETPVYKRLWLGRQGVFGHASGDFACLTADAMKSWLQQRLESPEVWSSGQLRSCARLADEMRSDSQFMAVAGLLRSRSDFDLVRLLGELVESEAVPHISAARYKESGLRKRASWERTWALQR